MTSAHQRGLLTGECSQRTSGSHAEQAQDEPGDEHDHELRHRPDDDGDDSRTPIQVQRLLYADQPRRGAIQARGANTQPSPGEMAATMPITPTTFQT